MMMRTAWRYGLRVTGVWGWGLCIDMKQVKVMMVMVMLCVTLALNSTLTATESGDDAILVSSLSFATATGVIDRETVSQSVCGITRRSIKFDPSDK